MHPFQLSGGGFLPFYLAYGSAFFYLIHVWIKTTGLLAAHHGVPVVVAVVAAATVVREVAVVLAAVAAGDVEAAAVVDVAVAEINIMQSGENL